MAKINKDKDENAKISEDVSPVAEQTQNKERMKTYEQALWLALLQSFPKPKTQKEKVHRETQKTKVIRRPGNQGEFQASGQMHTKSRKSCLGREDRSCIQRTKRRSWDGRSPLPAWSLRSQPSKEPKFRLLYQWCLRLCKARVVYLQWFAGDTNIEEATMQKLDFPPGVFSFTYNEIFWRVVE